MRTYDALRGCDQVFLSFDCPCGAEANIDFEHPHGKPLDAADVEKAKADHIAEDVRIGRLHE